MHDDGLIEAEGEGYFASVSDLMVGVLFVFLLMMTVFALNYRDDTARLDATRAEVEALKAQNQLIFAKLHEAATALQHELQDREQMRAGLLRRLAQRLNSAGISFVVDQESGVLHLSDAVPFATGSSDLTLPTAKHTVSVLAKVLADILPCFSHDGTRGVCEPGDAAILETVLVEGHTDRQQYQALSPQQSEAENDRLSTARALTVFAAIRQSEPSLDALKNPGGQPLLGVSGYGQRRPLPGTEAGSDEALTRNRRIDLRFVLSARNSEKLQRLLDDINAIHQAGAK